MKIESRMISDVVARLVEKAVIELPEDVKKALQEAFEKETNQLARVQLEAILNNIKIANEKHVPLCQDTGLPIFYVELGTEVKIDGNLENAIKEGVRKATSSAGPLRPNAVHPLTRENPGSNVGRFIPFIDWSFLPGEDYLTITAFPKGFGSELQSIVAMLRAGAGTHAVKELVLRTVVNAGGKACPPVIVGVGIGGTIDIATKLAKKALVRPIAVRHEENDIAKLEDEFLEAVNSTGIGPMGLGGDTTALSVNIEYAYTHIAALPVCVNLQCWANRHSKVKISGDSTLEYLN